MRKEFEYEYIILQICLPIYNCYIQIKSNIKDNRLSCRQGNLKYCQRLQIFFSLNKKKVFYLDKK